MQRKYSKNAFIMTAKRMTRFEKIGDEVSDVFAHYCANCCALFLFGILAAENYRTGEMLTILWETRWKFCVLQEIHRVITTEHRQRSRPCLLCAVFYV